MTRRKRRGAFKNTGLAVRIGARSLSDLAKEPEVALALDNDAGLSVAESVLRLRAHRNLTQGQLARLMKTSQPAVARIEAGNSNLTMGTVERLTKALDGRLRLWIQPAELHLPSIPPWWEMLVAGSVEPHQVTAMHFERGAVDKFAAGWTSSPQPIAFLEDASEILELREQTLEVTPMPQLKEAS